MLFPLLFIAVSLFFGVVIAKRIKELDDSHKILAFATGFGLLTGIWACFLSSWALGQLSNASIALASAIIALATIIVHWKTKEVKGKAKKLDKTAIAIVGLFLLLMFLLNARLLINYNEAGSVTVGANIWGDYPLHLGMIYSFSERPNYPPTYPQFIGVPLVYPFLINFFSAIFLVGGFTLKAALLIPHMLFYFTIFSFAYFFALKALKSKAGAVFVVLLFFLNGNYGIANAIQDYQHNPDLLSHLPRAYSHIVEGNIEFMNVLFSTFIPQRSAIIGFAIAFLIFYLLYGDRDKRKLAVAGVATGLLPLAHTPSFAAALAVAITFFAFDLYKSKKRFDTLKTWLWFFAPAIILALPQLLFLKGQVSDAFYTQRWGWMFEYTPSIQEFIHFWVANAWIPLILGVFGFFKAPKELKLFFIPLIVFFVVANSFKLAPWDWDSIKILTYWFFGLTILAAIPLLEMWNKARIHWRVLVSIIILVSIASGVLTVAWWWNDRPVLYSPRDFVIANWVKANTPATAIWITSNDHNHVIPSLTGRQTVLGLKWWAYSHGLEAWKLPVERKINEFYPTANCAIAREFNASYVFVGPQETAIENANPSKFENNPSYKKIFDQTIEGRNTKIFEVHC